MNSRVSLPAQPIQTVADRAAGAYRHVGAQSTYTRVQLASGLGYTNSRSGRLASLISDMQHYGLVRRRGSSYQFTELFESWFLAAEQFQARGSLVEASLHPPLFRQLYEAFLQRQLPTDCANWLLVHAHGGLDSSNAQIAGRVFMQNVLDLGLLKAGVLQPADAVFAPPQPDGPQTNPMGQADSLSVPEPRASASAKPVSTIEKNFGNGRIARISVPADLTQDERDALMALIQYV